MEVTKWTKCLIRNKVFATYQILQLSLMIIYSTVHYVGWDSAVGTATRYGLDDPGIESRWEARFSAPGQTVPGTHSASLSGVERPWHGDEHLHPSRAEVKERVKLYVYSPSGPSWPVLGWTLTVQYSTVQYSTVQYSTVQYCTVQYCTVQYSTVQYSTVQYTTVQ